jgi:hypothetical protein
MNGVKHVLRSHMKKHKRGLFQPGLKPFGRDNDTRIILRVDVGTSGKTDSQNKNYTSQVGHNSVFAAKIGKTRGASPKERI